MSTFTVHCSLQTASGRMFVHAREHDNPSNMRYMGLTVGKYIPDMTKAQSESWTGASLPFTLHATTLCLAPEHLVGAACPAVNRVSMACPCADAGIIHEQDTLRQSLHELIIDPLLASAMPSQVRPCLLSALALVAVLHPCSYFAACHWRAREIQCRLQP